jgi:hypothetical protein
MKAARRKVQFARAAPGAAPRRRLWSAARRVDVRGAVVPVAPLEVRRHRGKPPRARGAGWRTPALAAPSPLWPTVRSSSSRSWPRSSTTARSCHTASSHACCRTVTSRCWPSSRSSRSCCRARRCASLASKRDLETLGRIRGIRNGNAEPAHLAAQQRYRVSYNRMKFERAQAGAQVKLALPYNSDGDHARLCLPKFPRMCPHRDQENGWPVLSWRRRRARPARSVRQARRAQGQGVLTTAVSRPANRPVAAGPRRDLIGVPLGAGAVEEAGLQYGWAGGGSGAAAPEAARRPLRRAAAHHSGARARRAPGRARRVRGAERQTG